METFSVYLGERQPLPRMFAAVGLHLDDLLAIEDFALFRFFGLR